ncbi:MAG: PP2C family protein-serine/threonine phosphatase, partial [Burkholderiales bacterium]|nr:PP2C family protein-serine/threonine phosphatase [Opitutaceae bacterium]
AIRGLAASRFGETEWDRDAVATAARRTDEVGAVAGAVDHLVGQLHAYLDELRSATARREAIESELRIAGEIQASFLPPALPPGAHPAVDFVARIKPAREAGGDLYDGFFLDDGRFLLVVGDVSGKGVSAALFMAVTATGIRALAAGTRDPGELLTRVNRLLCERNDTLQFVTAFAALYDPASGDFSWTNCGHPPAAVLRADGRYELLQAIARATPLAVFETNRYVAHHARLEPGDTLLAYTDGVTEAMDARDTLYGDARLQDVLNGRRLDSAATAIETVLADVLAHQGEAPQADDITLVALRRVPR